MLKSKKYILIFGITILLCMVFAVNIGYTFCATVYDLTINLNGKANANGDGTYTYLHDVQISNSTTEIPIPYTLGTVNREISFDYSFSQNTDYVVVYNLRYTDGTAVTNVHLNVDNRDDYIIDVRMVSSETSGLHYNGSEDSGTMYYLPCIETGSGKQVLFTGVTFYEATNGVDYTNKKLKIDVKVYTKANVTATNETASEYYTTSHYFGNYIQDSSSTAFTNWINYKKNTTIDGNGTISNTISSNSVMIYNSRATFDSGMPYTYDFAYDTDITTIQRRADINSTYLYTTDNNFYAYAGGNKFDAGVGVYYMASTEGSIKVSVGVNWYDENGNILTDMPISNINVGINSNFRDIGNNYYGYTKKISANSYGYLDIVDYIETITKGDIYNYVGYKIIITSVTAIYTSDYDTGWSPSGTPLTNSVNVHNSTKCNPVLYRYANEMTTSGNIDFNVSIENNTDNAITISSVQLTPKFYAYNGQTGTNYAVANTKYLSTVASADKDRVGDGVSSTELIYDINSWSLTSTTNNIYTFVSNGIYIAPHSTLTLLSGAYVIAQMPTDWQVIVGENNYYADYWFDIDVNNISYSTASLNKTKTTQAELISELTTATISNGATSYIAVKNNTSQTMTNITFTGTLVNIESVSSDITYTLYDYANGTTISNTEESTISVTFSSINLLPGESIIIAKVAITSGENIGLNSYTITANLSTTLPTYSKTYAYRDFASGNLLIKNPTTSDCAISMSLIDFSKKTTITTPATLNGGTDKWTYSTTMTYDTPLREGQTLLVLNNYYTANITPTLA